MAIILVNFVDGFAMKHSLLGYAAYLFPPQTYHCFAMMKMEYSA
jgi:hypothetical protein